MSLSLDHPFVRIVKTRKTLTLLGGIYRRQGENDEAILILRRAIALSPDSPSAHYELGVVLARSGEKEEARAKLGQALEMGNFAEEPAARQELSRLGS